VKRQFLAGMVLVMWLAVLPVFAQTTPSVEIVLSDTEAPPGSTIFADLYIRDGTAIAGADVGVTVDGNCLRVTGREEGNYLPTSGDAGGFSPFEEMTDTSARFAANVTDRARIANGDGVFFRVVLETLCDSGSSTIEVTYAQLAALADPESGSNDLTAYSLELGNLPVNSVQVTISADAPTAEPAATLAPLSDRQVTAADVTPETDGNQTLLVVAAVVAAVAGLGTVGMFAMIMRSRKRRG
jgi:hypothetical protein